MTTVRLVMGDQVSLEVSALADLDIERDLVLMVEAEEECREVPHHQQKIVLFLSAMRHFAAELRSRGVRVEYVRLDDPDNTGSFTGEVARAVGRHGVRRLVVTEPGEWRVQEAVAGWERRFGVAVEMRADTRFFASRARFRAWAAGRRVWRMEHFYREMRRAHDVLMQGDAPLGGRGISMRRTASGCRRGWRCRCGGGLSPMRSRAR
jgi:deoxyribodipyrimidine photolyase-related protein